MPIAGIRSVVKQECSGHESVHNVQNCLIAGICSFAKQDCSGHETVYNVHICLLLESVLLQNKSEVDMKVYTMYKTA